MKEYIRIPDWAKREKPWVVYEVCEAENSESNAELLFTITADAELQILQSRN